MSSTQSNIERSSRPPGSLRVVLRKIFSFPVLLGVLLLAAVFVGRLLNSQQSGAVRSLSMYWLEGDTWWHMAVGNQILKTHNWPTHDPYSFTVHGSPWIAYEWLGDVIIALAWRVGGLQALLAMLIALAAVILLLLYMQAYLRCRNFKSAFVACAIVLPLVSLSVTMRPQLFGYVFLIATLLLLEAFRKGRTNALWALPLIFLLWVNAHGTFVLGFLILGVYWASGLKAFEYGGLFAERWSEQQRRRLELTFLLCLLASLVTPYGTRLAAYPLELASSQHLVVRYVQEWQPLDLTRFYGKYFLLLLLVFWLLLATSRLRCRLQDMILLAFAAVETFAHARFILLFVPVFAPLLAEWIARWIPKYESAKDHHVLNFALIALIAIGIGKWFPSSEELEHQVESNMPAGGVSYLRSHSGLGRTFNDAYWGGFLIDQLGPAHGVFIDGRFDIYEYSGVMADYLSIIRLAPETPFLLKKYQIKSCLIPQESALAVMLAASPDWEELYRDNVSAVFVRESGQKGHDRALGGPPTPEPSRPPSSHLPSRASFR